MFSAPSLAITAVPFNSQIAASPLSFCHSTSERQSRLKSPVRRYASWALERYILDKASGCQTNCRKLKSAVPCWAMSRY